MKSSVYAGKMMLYEFRKAAMMKLICYGLKRRKVQQNLIEPATHALTVLRNEAWDAAGRNDTCHENDTV